MRRHLKAALAIVFTLAGGGAEAGDLTGAKLLPMAPALPSFYAWTGFYLGIQGGYAWDSGRLKAFYVQGGTPTGIDARYGGDTAVGGGHAGFNYQMGALVLGAEADIEAVDGRGGVDAPGLPLRVKRDWQGSLRGRIGYALDNILVYATAGVSFTDIEHSYANPVTLLPEAGSSSRAGYTVGGGVNYGLTDRLILGLDYRYTGYGTFGHAGQSAVPGLAIEQNPTMHTVRASIAYKF